MKKKESFVNFNQRISKEKIPIKIKLNAFL